MSIQHYLVHEERHLNTPPQSKLLYLSTSQYNTEWNCALHTNVCSVLPADTAAFRPIRRSSLSRSMIWW